MTVFNFKQNSAGNAKVDNCTTQVLIVLAAIALVNHMERATNILFTVKSFAPKPIKRQKAEIDGAEDQR